eukprot:g21556.t1
MKMGKTLEEEGGKLQEEERQTIGKEQLDLDVKLEKKEAKLEEQVREAQQLLAKEEKALEELPTLEALEKNVGCRIATVEEFLEQAEKVTKVQSEKVLMEEERQRLKLEELEIKKSERRIDEEHERRIPTDETEEKNLLESTSVLSVQEVKRLRRDRALRVFNVLPAFGNLLGMPR